MIICRSTRMRKTTSMAKMDMVMPPENWKLLRSMLFFLPFYYHLEFDDLVLVFFNWCCTLCFRCIRLRLQYGLLRIHDVGQHFFVLGLTSELLFHFLLRFVKDRRQIGNRSWRLHYFVSENLLHDILVDGGRGVSVSASQVGLDFVGNHLVAFPADDVHHRLSAHHL